MSTETNGVVELWQFGRRRRSDGDIEGMEGREEREMPLWWQDSLTSGPQEACQGLNGITPHVIYFMALGWCPMCQELQKIPTAILTLSCR